MDRLSKKCVIASGIVHGTLVLLLIVGPAFLPSDKTLSSNEILTIIPDIASADGIAVIGQGTPNGGRQNPTPPPPTPRPPTPTPPAPAPPVVERVKDTPKDDPRKLTDNDIKPVERAPKPDPDALEAAKPRKPQVSLTPVVRKPSTATAKPNTSAADERAQARAEAQRAARRFEAAANNISTGASSGVEVGPIGVATGSGPSVAAFGDILRSIYFNNWREPSDATSEDAVVKATVTVARDGSVISARITKSSGDPAVDRTVQRTLENVTQIAPFPESWKESQRQFQLSFSLKAKRSLG